jgi:hypothetical protein
MHGKNKQAFFNPTILEETKLVKSYQDSISCDPGFMRQKRSKDIDTSMQPLPDIEDTPTCLAAIQNGT